jgi:hypothetical protein
MAAENNLDTLPDGSTGSVPGTNGLLRLNYFNGRFLTAESMRREQMYWDLRARLVGEIHPPGIAWGLGLRYSADWPAPSTTNDNPGPFEPRNGLSLDTQVKLLPGLAFDGVGRPISVGAERAFTFKQMLDQYVSHQTVVVGGGTQFEPCVCLAPAVPGTVTSGALIPPGPYLLVIEPTETPEGEAKVYGNVCATGRPALCEADAWRGGFRLFLTRFPVDVPMNQVQSAWDLRGVLSAYYYDVHEHRLSTRWDEPFPRAGANGMPPGFCAGPGPLDRQAGVVPLAMVYVGSDSTILFVDPWVPRRPMAGTASAAWSANLRGAPTAAACVSRMHQFQCMLEESLSAWPLPVIDGDTRPGRRNLYRRGFRHLPPFGFLPIPTPLDPQPSSKEGEDSRTLLFSEALSILNVEQNVAEYFAGTNVLTYTVVAIHDDDILEDMIRAMEKDPIVLLECEDDDEGSEQNPRGNENNPLLTLLMTALQPLIRLLRGHCGGLTMERLINREIEVVKLVIPMSGRRRVHPVVGRVEEEPLARLIQTWRAKLGNDIPGVDTSLFARLVGDLLGAAAVPRSFVFYVKQRMVLLDWLYLVIDFILDLLSFAASIGGGKVSGVRSTVAVEEAPRPKGVGETVLGGIGLSSPAAATLANSFRPVVKRDPEAMVLSTGQLREAVQARAGRVRVPVAALLSDTTLRPVVLGAARTWAPELSMPGTWSAYDTERERIRARMLESGMPAKDAERMARDEAIDVMLREHAGFAVVKAAAVLGDTEVGVVESALRADVGPATASQKETMASEVFFMQGYTPWKDERSRDMFDAARRAYGTRPVTERVAHVEVTRAFPINEVLAGTGFRLKQTVGTSDARRVTATLKQDGQSLVRVVNSVSGSKALASPEFWKSYDEAAAKSEGDPGKALEQLAKSGDEESRRVARELGTLQAPLGRKGLEEFLLSTRKLSA